jgi:hypothetical protein
MSHPRIAWIGFTWKMCTRKRWDPDQLLDCRHELLPHRGSSRSYACRVIRFSLARCKLARVLIHLAYVGLVEAQQIKAG